MSETLHCTYHPDRETVLRCSKCGDPICPQCGIRTPVGTRCRRCAQVQRVPTYQIDSSILLRGFAAGLAVAVVASLVVGAVLRGFSLWLSPVAGLAIAGAMGWATNQKRGRALQAVAVVAVSSGTALGNLALLLAAGVEPLRALSLLLGGYGLNVFYLVLASVFAVIRLK